MHFEVAADLARLVVARPLIDVKAADVLGRRVEGAVQGVAVQEAAGDVVSVRQRSIDGGQHGEGLALAGFEMRRPGAEARWRGLGGRGAGPADAQSRGRGQELAACDAVEAVLHGEPRRRRKAGRVVSISAHDSTTVGPAPAKSAACLRNRRLYNRMLESEQKFRPRSSIG